jgi:hypothetical protein
MPSLGSYVPAILFILVVGLVNFPISLKLSKKSMILVMIIPGVFLVLGGILFLLGSVLNLGWGSLGYFIIGGILLLGGIGSAISSLVVFLKSKNRKSKNESNL